MQNGHQPRFKTAKLYLGNQIKAVMSSLKVILVLYSIIWDGESSKLSTSIRIVTAYLTNQSIRIRILHGFWTLNISFIADTPRHLMCIHGTFTALDLLSWQSISEVVEEPRSNIHVYINICCILYVYVYVYVADQEQITPCFSSHKKTFCKVFHPCVSQLGLPHSDLKLNRLPFEVGFWFLSFLEMHQNPLRPNGNELQSLFCNHQKQRNWGWHGLQVRGQLRLRKEDIPWQEAAFEGHETLGTSLTIPSNCPSVAAIQRSNPTLRRQSRFYESKTLLQNKGLDLTQDCIQPNLTQPHHYLESSKVHAVPYWKDWPCQQFVLGLELADFEMHLHDNE